MTSMRVALTAFLLCLGLILELSTVWRGPTAMATSAGAKATATPASGTTAMATSTPGTSAGRTIVYSGTPVTAAASSGPANVPNSGGGGMATKVLPGAGPLPPTGGAAGRSPFPDALWALAPLLLTAGLLLRRGRTRKQTDV